MHETSSSRLTHQQPSPQCLNLLPEVLLLEKPQSTAHLRCAGFLFMEVEVYDVAHFLAAPVYIPVMPVKW